MRFYRDTKVGNTKTVALDLVEDVIMQMFMRQIVVQTSLVVMKLF